MRKDFEKNYKDESGFDVGKIHEMRITYYSEDYVNWIELKLQSKFKINNRELLKKAFEAGLEYQGNINAYSGKPKNDIIPSFTKWYNDLVKEKTPPIK
jgi:hypothetical protein